MAFTQVTNYFVANTEPSSTNFLAPTKFQFVLQRTPTTNYFVQAVTLPSLNIGIVERKNPFATLSVPGSTLEFGELEIRFRVDEEMRNYNEIMNWMVGMGHPETFQQYSDLMNSGVLKGKEDITNVFSDGTLIILTSNENPSISISFEDMFPISLSPLTFDTTDGDMTYLESSVSFKYKTFSVKNI